MLDFFGDIGGLLDMLVIKGFVKIEMSDQSIFVMILFM